MVKSPYKIVCSLLVFILGPFLLFGIFFLDHLPFMQNFQEMKKNHLIAGEYFQMEALSDSLNQLVNERDQFSSLNYRELIVVEKAWLLRITQMLDQDFLIRENLLRESTKKFMVLTDIINKSDEGFLQGEKIDILNDNIQSFKLFLNSHKMFANLSHLNHFEQTWLILEKQFFKKKMTNLATWKSSLQKIEETTLMAPLSSEMKEMVLEKLYFLREASNDLKGLFSLSNAYLEHSSKMTIWIMFILDAVFYNKENIFLSYESSDYVRTIIMIALFSGALAMIICSFVRNLLNKSKLIIKKEEILVQPSALVNQSIPARFYDDEEMLRQQVNLVLDETIRELKTNQTTHSPKKNKRPHRNLKRLN